MKQHIIFIICLFCICLIACDNTPDVPPNLDVRQEMRDFVIGISQYAKASDPGFAVIPQNGVELVTENGEEDGNPSMAYINAIDGTRTGGSLLWL